MHNFPTAMQQNFSFNPLMQTQAFAQTSQSTSFNSMPGGLPNQHMMYGMPPSQMLPGAYQMVQHDSMQYAAADQRVPVSQVPQGALPHQMMQAAPATSAMHHAANGVEMHHQVSINFLLQAQLVMSRKIVLVNLYPQLLIASRKVCPIVRLLRAVLLLAATCCRPQCGYRTLK
ncbi:hypothetical protein EB796_016220 [Bugula neritina]|uniref:Uncharacterized protein n=1 Tax=Bugula neritina TaxID=10212 RepID=A0A7J7JIY1_BUGNE|nr:hypothetical protein EB796_016220 [Bugula neritina]